MSTTIHQIYCTHCTFGTSALERREGEIAQRVLGYSARAGSLERDELRKVFRHVERYLYYSLPSDTPSEEKLRLDAASAPRRLIFLPSVGGLQVVGQVSYRQKDTSRDQRVGSYFGHLLVSEPKSEPWSVLDCLQLWGAPWVAEDSPSIPFQLRTLAGLNRLRTSPRPAIDDAVLVSFLTAPPGQPFDDPQQVIPPRWRNVSRTERVSLLADILRAYLELGAGRRESVLVVVEPSLAALLFYGVARLIPAGKLRDEVSFSTFEPNPDRLQTSLAATTFHDPKNSDLKPDTYRRPGWVINTFLNKNSTSAPRSKGVFARLVLDKLAAQGLNSVDELLASFQAVSIERPADLELLAEASAVVPVLLNPGTAASDAAWQNSPWTAAFLNVAIRRQLAGLSPNSAQWQELARGLNGLTLLELLAPASEGREDPVVLALLRNLPAERFLDLLGSKRIPLGYKADALAASIARTGRFPEDCPQLWDGPPASTKEPGGVAKQLLPAVLARLDVQMLQQLKPLATPELTRAFMIGLVQASKLNPAIQSLADSRVTGLDDEQLIDFLTDHDGELRPFYPDGETQLSSRLRNILFDTPLVPQEFVKRLDLLRAWDHFLNNDYEMELWLLPLEKIRKEFVALGDAIAQQNAVAKSRWTKQPSINYNEIGRRLLDAIELAMPAKRYGTDDRGAKKVECLREAGRAVLGQKDFGSLDQTFWAAIANHFDGFRWSETQLAKTRASSGNRSTSRRASQSSLSTPTKIIGIVAILSVLGGLTYAVSGLMRGKPSGIQVAESTQPAKGPTNEKMSAATTPVASTAPSIDAPPSGRPSDKSLDVSRRSTDPLPADPVRVKNDRPHSTPAPTPAALPTATSTGTMTPANAPPLPAPPPGAGARITKPPTAPAQASVEPVNPPPDAPAPPRKSHAPHGNVKPTHAPAPSSKILATSPDEAPPWNANSEAIVAKSAVPYEEVSSSEVKLKAIDSHRPANDITLKLHGLSDELLAKSGAAKNGCVLDVDLSNGPKLARFRQEGHNILFAWTDPAAWSDPAPVQHFRNDLCHCVLEVDVNDDGSPIYVALMGRIVLQGLPLKNGTATIDLRNLISGGGPSGLALNLAAWDSQKFKLGKGCLYTKGSKAAGDERFEFSREIDGRGLFSVPGLAKALRLDGEIEVQFSATNENVQFNLEIKGARDRLNALEAEQDKIPKDLQCVQSRKRQKGFDTALQDLATGLGKPVPQQGKPGKDQSPEDAEASYKRAILEQIILPSRDRKKAVDESVKELKKSIERAECMELSARLYREVQTDDKRTIRVESVIIGEPPTDLARNSEK